MKLKSFLLITSATLLSTTAFADNYATGAVPSNSSLYVGLQAGFADTHWNWAKDDSNDTGFAGAVIAGYEFNRNFSIEAGYVGLPQQTYDVNLLGKLRVPVGQRVGIFAKAGPSYLWTTNGVFGDNAHAFNLAYGLGADYSLRPNFTIDVNYMRFSGHPGSTDTNTYMPDVDYYAVGLTYKFNAL